MNNVQGYIFLPDNWSLPGGMSFTANIKGWDINTYSATDWAGMEWKGAVFLPAAGGRSGTTVVRVGSVGDYWSSAPYGTDYAYDLYFNSGNIHPQGSDYRGIGRSVRLVR